MILVVHYYLDCGLTGGGQGPSDGDWSNPLNWYTDAGFSTLAPGVPPSDGTAYVHPKGSTPWSNVPNDFNGYGFDDAGYTGGLNSQDLSGWVIGGESGGELKWHGLGDSTGWIGDASDAVGTFDTPGGADNFGLVGKTAFSNGANNNGTCGGGSTFASGSVNNGCAGDNAAPAAGQEDVIYDGAGAGQTAWGSTIPRARARNDVGFFAGYFDVLGLTWEATAPATFIPLDSEINLSQGGVDVYRAVDFQLFSSSFTVRPRTRTAIPTITNCTGTIQVDFSRIGPSVALTHGSFFRG